MPWEKLSRKVVAPALISALRTSGRLVAGPIVATIFVRRRDFCSCINGDAMSEQKKTTMARHDRTDYLRGQLTPSQPKKEDILLHLAYGLTDLPQRY